MTISNQSTVHESIQTFLDNLNSQHTRKAYAADIKWFFQYLRNKDLEQLTPGDLTVTPEEMEQYKSMLIEKYVSTTTVNRKLSSVRGLYIHLSKTFIHSSDTIDLTTPIKTHGISDDPTYSSYSAITYDEYLAILDALEIQQHKGKQKRLFLELALQTGFAVETIRGLTWVNFMHDAERESYEIVIKNGEIIKETAIISENMYKNLYETLFNVYDPKKENAVLFSMAENTISVMIKKACETLGLEQDGRKIGYNSIRRLAQSQTAGDRA